MTDVHSGNPSHPGKTCMSSLIIYKLCVLKRKSIHKAFFAWTNEGSDQTDVLVCAESILLFIALDYDVMSRKSKMETSPCVTANH